MLDVGALEILVFDVLVLDVDVEIARGIFFPGDALEILHHAGNALFPKTSDVDVLYRKEEGRIIL